MMDKTKILRISSLETMSEVELYIWEVFYTDEFAESVNVKKAVQRADAIILKVRTVIDTSE